MGQVAATDEYLSIEDVLHEDQAYDVHAVDRCEPARDLFIKKFMIEQANRKQESRNAVVGYDHLYEVGGRPRLKQNSSWTWSLAERPSGGDLSIEPTDPAKDVGYEYDAELSKLAVERSALLPVEAFGPIEVETSGPGPTGPVTVTSEEGKVALYFDKFERDIRTDVPNWIASWSQIEVLQDYVDLLPKTWVFDASTGGCDSVLVRPTISFQFNSSFDAKAIPLYISTVNSNGERERRPVTSETAAGVFGATARSLSPGSRVSNEHPCYGRYENPDARIITVLPPITILFGQTAAFKNGALNDHPAVVSFAETFLHELEHAKIIIEQYMGAMYYRGDADGDDYSDRWESEFASNYPDLAADYPFDPNNKSDDVYVADYLGCFDVDVNTQRLSPKKPRPNGCTNGTMYEEIRVRATALDALSLKDQLVRHDWSYDRGGYKFRFPNRIFDPNALEIRAQGANWLRAK